MVAGQPGEADWAGWEERRTVLGWGQPQRSGDQLRYLRVASTRLVTPCVPAPAGWKSLSNLALKCLDVLPLKREEVQKGLGHPPDTAAPSTWTWIGEEREM